MFEAAVKADCPDCEVLYSNANQDAAKQQQQAEAAITQGADVIVMSAVDGKSAVTIVQNAKSQGVPVVAYDRFIAGSDYYVSFDNNKVGQLQGTGLVEAMKADGKTSGDIVMINGAPTDANAADFKAGRAQRPRLQRLHDRGRVRHPGLEPRQRPGVDGEPDRQRPEATSSASTPPTTAPPVAPSRPSRVAASPRCRR